MPATTSGGPSKGGRASTSKTSSDTMTTSASPSSSLKTNGPKTNDSATGAKRPTTTLGAWIRSQRRALGLTQARLCELADIPQRKTLSRAETGRTRPTELSMLRIAKVLGPPPANVIKAGEYTGIASVLRTLEPSPHLRAQSQIRTRDKSHPERTQQQRRETHRERRRPISWIKAGGAEDE